MFLTFTIYICMENMFTVFLLEVSENIIVK